MNHCLACNADIPEGQGIHLSGVGWLCNATKCYSDFNKARERRFAKEAYQRA